MERMWPMRDSPGCQLNTFSKRSGICAVGLGHAIHFSSPLWDILKPWTTVQSRFDISHKVARLCEERKDVVVEKVFSGLGFWEDENREEC